MPKTRAFLTSQPSMALRAAEVPDDFEDTAAVGRTMRETALELEDHGQVIRKNRENCVALLRDVARYVETWKWTVTREKAIYHTLNLFTADVPTVLRAEGWVVASARDTVAARVAMARASVWLRCSRAHAT